MSQLLSPKITSMPTADSIVVAKIVKVSESGLFVSLVEYGDQMAFAPTSEMSQRKSSSIAKHLPVGSLCAFRVLNVTAEGIDLTRKKIDAEVGSEAVNNYLTRYQKTIILNNSKTDLNQ